MTIPTVWAIQGSAWDGYSTSGAAPIAGMLAQASWGRAVANARFEGADDMASVSAILIEVPQEPVIIADQAPMQPPSAIYGPYSVQSISRNNEQRTLEIAAVTDQAMQYLLTDAEDSDNRWNLFVGDVTRLIGGSNPWQRWAMPGSRTAGALETTTTEFAGREITRTSRVSHALADTPADTILTLITSAAQQATSLAAVNAATEPWGITVYPYYDAGLNLRFLPLPLYPIAAENYMADEFISGIVGPITSLSNRVSTGAIARELANVDITSVTVSTPDVHNLPGGYQTRRIKGGVYFAASNINDTTTFIQGTDEEPIYLDQNTGPELMTIAADVERWRLQHTARTLSLTAHDARYLAPRHRITYDPNPMEGVDAPTWIVDDVRHVYNPAQTGYAQLVSAHLEQPLPAGQASNLIMMV